MHIHPSNQKFYPRICGSRIECLDILYHRWSSECDVLHDWVDQVEDDHPRLIETIEVECVQLALHHSLTDQGYFNSTTIPSTRVGLKGSMSQL